MSESVSGPDIETLLAAHERTDLGCSCGWKDYLHLGRVAVHRAHVAAVLRAYIVTAQADAWDEALVEASERGFLVAGYLAMVQANPYRAALVGQIGADHD